MSIAMSFGGGGIRLSLRDYASQRYAPSASAKTTRAGPDSAPSQLRLRLRFHTPSVALVISQKCPISGQMFQNCAKSVRLHNNFQ